MTMLTLDSTTFFFYSCIISNKDKPVPPPKKRKAKCDPISTWIDNVRPSTLPSRAANKTSKTTLQSATSHSPPSLMAGLTCSLNSTLTNTIHITQNALLPTTAIKKECKEVHIEVMDNGAFSDYNKTEGQGWERALASGVKHGVHATSSVSHIHIFWSILALPLFTRTSSLSTHQSPPKALKPFMKSGLPDELDYGLLCHTVIPTIIKNFTCQRDPWDCPAYILCNEIYTIIRHTGNVDFKVNSKSSIYKMYIHALLHTVLLSCLPDNSMAGWQLASFLYVNAKGNNMSVSYHYGSFFYLADYIYNRNGMASSVVELSWSTLQLTSQQLKLPNESQILKLMVWNLHFLGHMVPLHWAQLG